MSRENDGITFVDPKSQRGRRFLTMQANHFRNGNEHFVVIKNEQLVCTIEKAPGGWIARFGTDAISHTMPTIESIKTLLGQRYNSRQETFIQITTAKNLPKGEFKEALLRYGVALNNLCLSDTINQVSESKEMKMVEKLPIFYLKGRQLKFASVPVYTKDSKSFINVKDLEN